MKFLDKIKIMQPLDELIFENIEKLKSNDKYQEFSENFNNLDEKAQLVGKGLMLAAVFFIPLLILLIFSSLNSSLENDLQAKEDILKTAQKILTQKGEIRSLSMKHLGQPITTQQRMETKIKSRIGTLSIEPTKIQVRDFDSFEEDGLNKASAKVTFKDLSNLNLYSFLKLITITNKMRVEEVEIKKNKQSNLLEGHLKVLHFSQAIEETEEDG